MKYLRKYNESLWISEISDIIKFNLEDNPYFDVIDITVIPLPISYKAEGNCVKVIINEIFGEDSLLWREDPEISLSFLSDISDKMFSINRKLLTKITKKYNFSIKDFHIVAGSAGSAECGFTCKRLNKTI